MLLTPCGRRDKSLIHNMLLSRFFNTVLTTIGPLSVLHVITGLGKGGAEETLVKLVTSRRKPERPIAVATLVGDGLNRERLEAAGVVVIDLGMKKGRANLVGLIRLAALIRLTRPQTVQCWMYHANLLGLIALWLSGRRWRTGLVWGIRCSNMDTRKYDRLLSFVIWAGKLFSHCPDVIVANSKSAVSFHRSLGYRAREFPRIDNGFDTDLYRPDPDIRTAIRRDLGIDEEAIVISIVARVDPMKNYELFLKVFDRLVGVQALAIGEGTDSLPDRPGLHRLGLREDVPSLLAASDMLVSTSGFGESFPNVVGEAMACGLPVVATDIGDTRRLVSEAGVIVQPGDEDSLVEALQGLAEDPDRRDRLGLSGRRRIETAFSIDRMIQGYERIYRVNLV